MKGDVVSSVELVLPDNVVDACYNLKRKVKACFRALNGEENTGSEITLQRLQDNSVKINVTVLSVDIESIRKDDFKEYCEYKIDTDYETDTDSDVVQKVNLVEAIKPKKNKRIKKSSTPNSPPSKKQRQENNISNNNNNNNKSVELQLPTETNNQQQLDCDGESYERELERLADIAEKIRPSNEIWKKSNEKKCSTSATADDVYNFSDETASAITVAQKSVACLPQKKRLAKRFQEIEEAEAELADNDMAAASASSSKETQIWTNDTEVLKTLINESTLSEGEKLKLKQTVLNSSIATVKLSAGTENNNHSPKTAVEVVERNNEGKNDIDDDDVVNLNHTHVKDLPPITTFTNAQGKKFKFIPTGRTNETDPPRLRSGTTYGSRNNNNTVGRKTTHTNNTITAAAATTTTAAASKFSSGGSGRRRYTREDLIINCRYCDANVRDYSYLFRHVKNLHGEEEGVEEYISEIRPLMRVACPICKVLVSSSSNMAAHIKQKHEKNERVICDICRKSYKTDISLRQHIRQCHSSDRKYECNECNANFTERRSLREHINCVHVTTVVFKCDECGKDFLTKGRLRRHKFIHGEHREFCNYCNKGFHLRDNMLKHIEIVHERKQGKRFKCEYCSKRFTVKGNMMQHMLGVHLRKFPYYCSVCYGGFRRKKEAVAHLEEKHGKEYEEVAVISGSTGNAQQFLISNPKFTGEEDDVRFVAKPRIGKVAKNELSRNSQYEDVSSDDNEGVENDDNEDEEENDYDEENQHININNNDNDDDDDDDSQESQSTNSHFNNLKPEDKEHEETLNALKENNIKDNDHDLQDLVIAEATTLQNESVNKNSIPTQELQRNERIVDQVETEIEKDVLEKESVASILAQMSS